MWRMNYTTRNGFRQRKRYFLLWSSNHWYRVSGPCVSVTRQPTRLASDSTSGHKASRIFRVLSRPQSRLSYCANAKSFTWLILFLLFALAAPFLFGVGNLMGLVIIAIGVYQAWKLTRAVPLSLTGPFTLAPEGGGVGAQEG